MDALIRVIGIAKKYGATEALAPTDLDIAQGKTTVLIGPSGCGKSTLLRLIIGLIDPDAGSVLFENAPVEPESMLQFRRRVGYVIQEGGLFPHLNARSNVLLMPRHLGKNETEMHDRLRELCELTQFPSEALDRYPAELSGGQRQRVSLMRALVLSPELLLLDEPLGALDPLVRAALQQDLKQIFGKLHQTAIVVTHDLAEAAYLGDTIVLMNGGRVVQKGSIDDLRVRPTNEFVREFINAQRSLVSL